MSSAPTGPAAAAAAPRLCCLEKGPDGYGFHLHGEKGKSGQFIRKVEPGSPAEAAGLRAGDRVVEVNGLNVEQETHHQVRARDPRDPPSSPPYPAPTPVRASANGLGREERGRAPQMSPREGPGGLGRAGCPPVPGYIC